MLCPQIECHAQLDSSNRVCPSCQEAWSECAACHAPNRPFSRFCSGCGTPFRFREPTPSELLPQGLSLSHFVGATATVVGPVGVWNSPVAFEGALWWLTEPGDLYRWVPGPAPPALVHSLTSDAGRCPYDLRWTQPPETSGAGGPPSQPVLVTRSRRRPVILGLQGVHEELPLEVSDTPHDLLGNASQDACRVDLSGSRLAYLSSSDTERRLHVASVSDGHSYSCVVPKDVCAGPITLGDYVVVYSDSTLFWAPCHGGELRSHPFPAGFTPIADPSRVTSPALPVGALPYWSSLGKLTVAGVSEGLPSLLRLSLADHGPRLRVVELVSAQRDVLLSALQDGTPVVSFEGTLRVFPKDQREDVDKDDFYGAHGPGFWMPPLLAGVTRTRLGRHEIRLGVHEKRDFKEIPDYQQGFGFYWVGGRLVFAWRDCDSALRLMAWLGGGA